MVYTQRPNHWRHALKGDGRGVELAGARAVGMLLGRTCECLTHGRLEPE